MTLPTFGTVGRSMVRNGATFVTKKRLTEFSNDDANPSKSGDRLVDGAGFGRPSELIDEEWLWRYESIRSFLQVEWGKVGFQLKRVQNREEVVALFKTLQDRGSREKPVERIVELLTTPSPVNYSPTTGRSARQKMKNVDRRFDLAWSEYHNHVAVFEKYNLAMQSAMLEFGTFAHYWAGFYLLFLCSEQLGVVPALEARARAEAELKSARDSKSEMGRRLLVVEAARAKQELLRFVANSRYETSLENLAAVMAGLPELCWISSLRRYRKCQPDNTSVQTNWQVFQFCDEVLRSSDIGTGLLDSTKLETTFWEKIQELDPRGVAYLLKWNWSDLRLSIAQLDMKVAREQLPYILTAKFEDNIARPKSFIEAALAEHARMEVWSKAS